MQGVLGKVHVRRIVLLNNRVCRQIPGVRQQSESESGKDPFDMQTTLQRHGKKQNPEHKQKQ